MIKLMATVLELEASVRRFFTLLGGEVLEMNGGFQGDTGSSLAFCNAVFSDPKAMEKPSSTADRVVAHFAERKLPFCWYVAAGEEPSSLDSRLTESQMLLWGVCEAMSLSESRQSSLELSEISSLVDLQRWCNFQARSYDLDTVGESELCRLLGPLLGSKELRCYSHSIDGEMVAATAVHLFCDSAVMWCDAFSTEALEDGTAARFLAAVAATVPERQLQVISAPSFVASFREAGFETFATYRVYVPGAGV